MIFTMEKNIKYILFAAGIFSIFYLLYNPFRFWLTDSRGDGPFQTILSYYPVLFMMLFIQKNFLKNPYKESLFLLSGIMAAAAGRYFQVSALMWFGAFWIFLPLLKNINLRFHVSAYILIFLAPPFNKGIEILLGFPLRIFLSEYSVFFLRIFDKTAYSSGNAISFQENLFSVDPACEGLKMLSALILTILYFYHSIDSGSIMQKLQTMTILAFSGLAFWMLSNFIRILILIMGNIGPESPLHDAVGLYLFITSSLLPLWIIKTALNKLFKKNTSSAIYKPFRSEIIHDKACVIKNKIYLFPFRLDILHSVATVVSVIILILFPANKTQHADHHSVLPEITERNGEFLQLEVPYREIDAYQSRNSNLIVKKNLNPVRIGHHPRLCWTGAGYSFLQERELEFTKSKSDLRIALLEKNHFNEKKFYILIWWYQNFPPESASENRSKAERLTHTASEIKWRKISLLRGLKFRQVNYFRKLKTKEEYTDLVKHINNLEKFDLSVISKDQDFL